MTAKSRHVRILLLRAEWEAVEVLAEAEGRSLSAMLGQLVRQALTKTPKSLLGH